LSPAPTLIEPLPVFPAGVLPPLAGTFPETPVEVGLLGSNPISISVQVVNGSFCSFNPFYLLNSLYLLANSGFI